jgi:hypothetical protein
VLLSGVAAPHAFADQINVAFVTCINPVGAVSCVDLPSGQQVWWRVLNTLAPSIRQVYSPFPGSNDLLDVRLEADFAEGTRSWSWDVVGSGAPPDLFVETEPFDASLVRGLVALRVTATLPRTVFDPLYADNEFLSFIADTPFVSASAGPVHGPLDVYAQGRFEIETPVIPEPTTLALVGGGLALLARSRRRRRRAMRRA